MFVGKRCVCMGGGPARAGAQALGSAATAGMSTRGRLLQGMQECPASATSPDRGRGMPWQCQRALRLRRRTFLTSPVRISLLFAVVVGNIQGSVALSPVVPLHGS